jgi:hypothetical protein
MKTALRAVGLWYTVKSLGGTKKKGFYQEAFIFCQGA